MKTWTPISFLFLMCLVFMACNNDDRVPRESLVNGGETSNNSKIGVEFIEHVNSFSDEMFSRNFNINISDLTVTFVDVISATNSQGFCAYGYPNFQNTGKPRIEVINNANCWSNRTYTERENLIYHELGHAILGLDHQNGTFPNGSQLSLMCSSSTCNNYRVYNKNQPEQREYYLDNMSGQSTITDWADEKKFSRTLDEEQFDENFENWQNLILNGANEGNEYEFFIDKNSPFSSPTSLGITSTSNTSSVIDGYWYKDYILSDFEYCANVTATVDIRAENVTDGFVAIVVDLMETGNTGDLEFFSRAFTLKNAPGNGITDYENTMTTAICLTQETEIVRVLFYYNATEKGTVYFDNLKLDLLE